MKSRLGEVFEGTVSAVTSFGLFIQLDELFIEGLVHVTELGGDYFQYDEVRHELRGERTGRRFQLTDRVRVQVTRVDLDARKIDLALVLGKSGAEGGEKMAGKGAGKMVHGKPTLRPSVAKASVPAVEVDEPHPANSRKKGRLLKESAPQKQKAPRAKAPAKVQRSRSKAKR
jgi:ribonuclease R